MSWGDAGRRGSRVLARSRVWAGLWVRAPRGRNARIWPHLARSEEGITRASCELDLGQLLLSSCASLAMMPLGPRR